MNNKYICCHIMFKNSIIIYIDIVLKNLSNYIIFGVVEMQEYNCTVKGIDGKTINNYKLKTEDESSLIAQLKSSGLYLVRYEVVEAKKDIVGGNKLKLSSKDISVLCRQLASMLTSGVTLVKALNILYLQMEKKNIKEAVKRLYEAVQKGEQFSEALRKQTNVYPELMISMVEAGEGSGRLDSVIEKLAAHYEKDVKLKAKIKTALTYPIILVVLCIAVVIILVTQVLPIFIGMFNEAGAELPLPTKMVMGFSQVLTGYWYLIILFSVIIALGFKVYLGTEAGLKNWHRLLLKIPVVNKTMTKLAAVRFTSTLSTLLSSGLNLLASLDISIKVVGNRVVMEGLNISKEDIRKGMPLSQSLRKVNVLPPMVYSMIGIGEESGSIEKMLEKCAEYYDNEVDNSITKLVSMIEPLLIIVMAVVVGFIVIAMMMPIFDIYGTVGG